MYSADDSGDLMWSYRHTWITQSVLVKVFTNLILIHEPILEG